jgi:mannitol/fructose-specific phosphotransferase system IIA component (Ntr-type)
MLNPAAKPLALPPLTTLLSADRIVIWDEPVLREEVLNTLVTAAMRDVDGSRQVDAGRKIWEREQQGSTFFNEGVAFPHARIDGLAEPRLAIGLTHCGIVDVATQKPVEVVFLILSPSHLPTTQLQMLALTSKAGQNRHLLQRLKTARSAKEALETIRSWELQL